MNEARPPTAEEQLAFLRSLQRLLDEGSFTASYKFALLHAIADLCVVKGDDSGAEFQLSTTKIAEQFIRLYWRQAAPYPASEEQHILSQNTGRQAAIVREVAKHRYLYQGSLADLESSGSDWVKLRRKVKYTVEKMPLNKLQNVGSEQLDFLYQIVDHGRAVRLKPGVTYCLRALYPMVTDMIEGAWLSFVQRRNPRLLGQAIDLRSFLFESQRRSLAKYRPLFREVQQGRCFYCESNLKLGGDVDHFIPWRRYALDLGHNFVLAHKGCNSSKSDLLAAEKHLERWTERNQSHAATLEEGFNERRIVHDWPATQSIAHLAYSQVYRARGQVWVAAKQLKPLSNRWREILSGAPHPPAAR